MKKTLTNILILSLVIVFVGGMFVPLVANAQTGVVGSFINWTLGGFSSMVSWVGGYILEISARILAISGMILNSAMNITLNISTLVNGTDAVDATWRVIRDFSSIFFIFILVYASISLIFGIDNFGIKKLIPRIVIVGLLINFSLFFTKAIIDVSNVAALGFYSAIAPKNDTSLRFGNGFYAADGGISNVFMQALGVVTIYDPIGTASAKENFGHKTIPVLYLGSVIMLIAAGSFIAISLMLMVRIVVLMLLMAFSPLFFISMILPKTEELGKKWMSTLIGQSLFPVVYLALIYVALKILTAFKFINQIQTAEKSAFSEAFSGGGNVAVIFNYAIVIILLNIALVQAVKFMGSSGKWTMKQYGVFKAFAGRSTLGWPAHAIRESDTFKTAAAAFPGVGRAVAGGLGKVADAKFGGKKSYKANFEANIKSKKDFHKYLGESQNDNKALGKERQSEYRTHLGERHLMGLMIKRRSDVKAYKDLKKDADKKQAKKDKDKNQKDLNAKEKEIREINEILENDLKLLAHSKSKEELMEEKAKLEKERDEIKEKLNLAKEAEEDDLVGKLKDKTKDDKDDKEDKKEEKKEDKDKEDKEE